MHNEELVNSNMTGAALCGRLIVEAAGIGQVQLVQESIDQLTIRLVPSRAEITGELDHFR